MGIRAGGRKGGEGGAGGGGGEDEVEGDGGLGEPEEAGEGASHRQWRNVLPGVGLNRAPYWLNA